MVGVVFLVLTGEVGSARLEQLPLAGCGLESVAVLVPGFGSGGWCC